MAEFDKTLPTWTHSKTYPIWDLMQDCARKSNEKGVVNWVVGGIFRDFLVGNMSASDWTQLNGILTDSYDRINACRSFLLDSLDPYEKKINMWISDYNGQLSAWLSAISDATALDYYWDLDDDHHPFMVDSKTKEEIHLEDSIHS